MSAILNIFQQLARQWDQIHPYNAAQILKIRGHADLPALQAAWHHAINALGLGRVRLDGNSFSYECLNGEMSLYGIRVVPLGLTLEEYVSEELNRKFDNPAEPPFRPFVLFGDGFYYAGVIYHHWVADSISIRTVLHEWFVRLFDPPQACHRPVQLAHAGYRTFFNIQKNAASFGLGLLGATRWASSLRRVRRVEYRCGTDLRVRVALRSLPNGWIANLHTAAKRRNVTLNDLFLAAIARVCDRHLPLKHRPRRHSLAIGSIVDLRPYAHPDLAQAFGLFLGFTNVICRPAELTDPDLLLRSISAQTHQQKRQGIPQASAIRMLAGVAAGKCIHPDKMAHFYRKHVPLAGGISNINLNQSWATRYHPEPLLDYIRVSPTGPMMPLVFATTTLGQDFHFTLTYRPSVVPPQQIDHLAAAFINALADYLP
jgi:hypothetical protein